VLKAIVLFSFLLSASTGLADTINIVGPTSSPAVGDTFAVDVAVTGITDLYAFQLDLNFDPTLLSAVSVSEGAFLPSGGTTFFIPGTIDNVAGSVAATADTLVGPIPGVTGDGVLLVFDFKALAAGASPLSFANEILLDSSLNDITADTTFQNGSVTVSGITHVPEPNTLVLVCIAVLGLITIRQLRPRVRVTRQLLLNSLSATAILLVWALSSVSPLLAQSGSYDAAAFFEQGWINHTNPNAVWSYGYSSSFTGPVTLYTSTVQNGVNGPNAQFWLAPSVDIGNSPAAEFNNGPAYDDGNVDFLANEFVLVAGIGGQYSDLVFTAPAPGTYQITSSFRGDQYCVGTVVGVVANGTLLFNSTVTAEGQVVPFNTQVSLSKGGTAVFSVGPGGGCQNTGVSATVSGPTGSGPLPLQITTSSLPNAITGDSYSAPLAAFGGSFAGYSWSVLSGSLPAGFTLSSAGLLSSTGSPAAAPRSYVFTIHVKDSAGHTANSAFTLVVNSLVTAGCVAPPSGIIAWWPFDETSGTIANDIAGDNLGAYVNSPIPVPGEVGEALSFNGGSYVGVADSNLWDFGTQDFTIELWTNFPAPPGGSVGEPGAIFIGHDAGGGPENKWFLAAAGGLLDFTSYPSSGVFLAQSPFTPVPGEWYHVAVTKMATTYTIFVNGAPVGSQVETAPISEAIAPLTIGQAENIGYMDGAVDEVTIYNRALSQAELLSIYNAGRAGKCKDLTITTPSLASVQLGTPFSQQLQASFGVPPYAWSVLNGSLPSGVILSSSGVLSGTSNSAGQSALTIEVTDGASSRAQKAFTLTSLVTLPPPSLRITKAGTQAVPGLISSYFILVENTGTTVAANIPVVEFLQMQNFTLQSVNPPALADVPTLAEASVIPWNIASLTPGQSTILEYQVEVNPTVPVGGTVIGTACIVQDLEDALIAVSHCYLDGAAVAAMACDACVPWCEATATACAFAEFDLPVCLAGMAICGRCISANVECVQAIGDQLQDCMDVVESSSSFNNAYYSCFGFNSTTKDSNDPNQKTVTAGRFIQPNQTLLYPIQYENDGNAAAQNVYVTDVLDPSLDPTTLQIITPNGFYNPATRTITWNLLGTELQPGASANVMFSILPLPNLASGTVIHNTATIKFDVNRSMATNQVTNVIDKTPPSSAMGALPWRTFAPNIPITWSGTDAISGVASYSVFESVNGGPFTPYLQNTTETQTSFTGVRGNTYAFISIATDGAGNIEAEQPVSKATILFSLPGDVNGDGVVNCTDVDIVKAAFGAKIGQPAYSKEADTNNDGVVNILDLAFVTQNLPKGTVCH